MMHLVVVPFVLAVTAQIGPSPAELERAHRLLAGTWDVLEMVDDGETLSHDLIRSKLAEGGRIRVVDRSFEIVNPETGEARKTAFRIDPSENPRRIDVISRDDRILRGIYRFEGDQLVICQQSKPEEPRPDTFEARAGSGRMLLRLKLASDSACSPHRFPPQRRRMPRKQHRPRQQQRAGRPKARLLVFATCSRGTGTSYRSSMTASRSAPS